jgi:hypothetical protein
MVFGSGCGRCRWDSFCKPAPGCATRRDEASRSPPPCWRCAPLHAGRSPANRRPPSSRSSSIGWSAGLPPNCWPVGNRPCRGRSGHLLLVASRPHPFRGGFRQARRCRAHRGIVGDHHPHRLNRSGDRQLNRAARYARNRRRGDALFLQAYSALRASPGARAFYDRQRARGATHYQALRALANRLVGILHGCLRNHTRYDEHLAWHSEPDKLSPAA